MIKQIHGHVVFNVRKIDDILFEYHYSCSFSYENEFHTVGGYSTAPNYSLFYDSVENHIIHYLNESQDNVNIILSDTCLNYETTKIH